MTTTNMTKFIPDAGKITVCQDIVCSFFYPPWSTIQFHHGYKKRNHHPKWVPPMPRLNQHPKWVPPKPRSGLLSSSIMDTKNRNQHPKWVPPKSRSESTTIHKPPAPVPGLNSLYFYSPYGGFRFPPTPILFQSPVEAISWGLSCFKRDDLSNVWGPESYPEFLRYVFLIEVDVGAAAQIPLPSTTMKTSQVEQSFFSCIICYQVSIGTVVYQFEYLRIKDPLFNRCASKMKSTPDYQTSSNFINRVRNV